MYQDCDHDYMGMSPPSSDSYHVQDEKNAVCQLREASKIEPNWHPPTGLSRPSEFRVSLGRPPKDPRRETSGMGCGRGTGEDETRPSAIIGVGGKERSKGSLDLPASVASCDSPMTTQLGYIPRSLNIHQIHRIL